MSLIGNLVVNLKAKTAAFDKKIKRARKTLTNFRKAVMRTGKALLKFGGVIAGVAVAIGGLMIRNSMKAIDKVGKLADRLEMATEDILAFRHAAVIAGGSIEGMDKGLDMLAARIGEVKTGSGEAAIIFKAMGLNAQALAKMGTAEAFRTIADEIAKMATAADRANAARKIFGRAGMDLLNVLMLGRKGIEAYNKRLKEMGLNFSRIDAAQVEAANDAIQELRFVLQAAANIAAIELAPAIAAIAKATTNWLTAGGGIQKKVLAVFEKLRGLLPKIAEGALVMSRAVVQAFQAMLKAGAAVARSWHNIKKGTAVFFAVAGQAHLAQQLKGAQKGPGQKAFAEGLAARAKALGDIDVALAGLQWRVVGGGLQKEAQKERNKLLQPDLSWMRPYATKVKSWWAGLKQKAELKGFQFMEWLKGGIPQQQQRRPVGEFMELQSARVSAAAMGVGQDPQLMELKKHTGLLNRIANNDTAGGLA